MKSTYRDIAKKYVKGNRNTTIILVSTIIIVTLVLTTLLTFYCSLDEMTKKQRAASGFYYYGAIVNVSDLDKGKIENHALVKESLEVNIEDEGLSIYLLTESKSEARDQLNKICNDVGISTDKLRINENLLDKTLIDNIKENIPYILITIMILASSFFIIYNIYSLSFKNRTQNYGLLKTIGFTKWQLTKCMLWEIVIVSLISIPIGVLLGIGISKILIPFAPYNSEILIVIKWWIAPVVLLIVFLTIILSANSPLKKVIKLSPIQGTKVSFFDGTVNEKDFSSLSLESSLSKANLSRNRKITLITILSLILSSVVYIMGSTIVKSMDIENQVEKYLISSDIKIWLEDERNTMGYGYISKKIVDQLKSNKDVSEIRTYKLMNAKEVTSKKSVGVYGLNDTAINMLKSNLLDGAVDLNKMKNENGAIYFCKSNEKDNPKYKVGDKVQVESTLKDGSKRIDTLEVQGIALSDMSNKQVTKSSEFYVLDDNDIVKNSEDYVVVQLECENFKIDDLKKEVTEITASNPNIKVNTVDDFVKLKTKEKGGIVLISYSIFILLGIIAMVNYINSITTSILSRKSEFAILRAVGVDKKRIKSVIRKEFIFISGVVAIISLIIGNILGYICVSIFSESATYSIYVFPMWSNIVFILLIFIIPGFITNLLGSKVLNENIIESIKAT
ncbi:MAG: FtsX-like permease family protein [Clostridium sp.]